MQTTFDQRVDLAWTESGWIIEDMFSHGMCLFEGYIPAVNLNSLELYLPQLADGDIDFRQSVWSDSTNEDDWNRVYDLADYVAYFRSGRIVMLHADYTATCSDYSFVLKLIFEPDANLEVIVYRENLLPPDETRSRFNAACYHLRYLHGLFDGAALFLGPDTLNYPEWPDSVPKEWQRLL